MTFQELQARYEEALSRVKELEKENARLKRVLQEHRIAVDEDVTAPKPVPKRRLSVEEKVELFRGLFKGREDVFARRWQGKENAGYQPACLNDKSPVCWGRKQSRPLVLYPQQGINYMLSLILFWCNLVYRTVMSSLS